MANSAFSPTLTVTGGTTQQGEINVITNPIAQTDTSGWTTSSVTLSRVATGSPLDPEIPTGFQAVSTTTTTSYIQTTLQLIAPSLRNRKLKLQFFLALTNSTSWKVDVFKSDGVTRYPLSTDSSAVSVIPALTGTYTTTFDMDTDTGIYVRFTRHAGAGTSTLNFTNLIVGPGIQPQGAAVQEWLSYPPTVSGFGIVTNLKGQYARIGNSLIGSVTFTGGTHTATSASVTLPSGLTVDSTKVTAITGLTNSVVGDLAASATPFDGTVVIVQNTGNTLYLAGNASSSITGSNGTAWANGTTISVNFQVPIAEWSGSGTVQLAQNDVEWAFNTSTTTANDSTSFGYGPIGALIQSFAPGVLSLVTKRIRFQTPIQDSDRVMLEVNDGLGWLPWEDRAPLFSRNEANTAYKGAYIDRVASNTTDVDVIFANVFDWSVAWSVLSGWRWRVRKSSAGAAIGFGLVVPGTSAGLVSASGVPGNTTGNAIASGFVGEKVTWASAPVSQVLTTSVADWTNANIVLGAGVWLVTANISMRYVTATTAGNAGNARFYVTDSANSIIQNMFKSLGTTTAAAAASRAQGSLTGAFVANLSASSTTYKIRVDRLDISGVGSGDVFNESGVYSEFFAIRIA